MSLSIRKNVHSPTIFNLGCKYRSYLKSSKRLKENGTTDLGVFPGIDAYQPSMVVSDCSRRNYPIPCEMLKDNEMI